MLLARVSASSSAGGASPKKEDKSDSRRYHKTSVLVHRVEMEKNNTVNSSNSSSKMGNLTETVANVTNGEKKTKTALE